MTTENNHHRRSVRIPAYDDAGPGAYFVTLVTQDRACVFGGIGDGAMQISARGRIAEECWRLIPHHFPNVGLGPYVVMPNHLHGILVIHDRAGVRSAHSMSTMNSLEPFGQSVSGALATIIGQYKSSVTRAIVAEFGGVPYVWQRNYYEHVIRDDGEWNRIYLYIESNIANWAEDVENTGTRGW
jgi:putative transposase